MKEMTIGRLAREGGVGVETVRYYQRRGLLKMPDRNGVMGPGSGIRRYTWEDVGRLRFIRQAQAAGFTLEEVGELLSLDAVADRQRVLTLATTRIHALDAKIAELQAARDALGALTHGCANGTGPCPILLAFETAR